jgi:hypothetical protein
MLFYAFRQIPIQKQITPKRVMRFVFNNLKEIQSIPFIVNGSVQQKCSLKPGIHYKRI